MSMARGAGNWSRWMLRRRVRRRESLSRGRVRWVGNWSRWRVRRRVMRRDSWSRWGVRRRNSLLR